MARNPDSSNILIMGKKESQDRTAERHRKAFRHWLNVLDLTVEGWCEKAGLTESALRHFLNGTSDSMKVNTVQALADAVGMTVGQLLREEYYSPVNEEVMNQIFQALKKAEQLTGKSLPVAEGMVFMSKAYNLIIEERQKGMEINPGEAVMSMMVKYKAN